MSGFKNSILIMLLLISGNALASDRGLVSSYGDPVNTLVANVKKDIQTTSTLRERLKIFMNFKGQLQKVDSAKLDINYAVNVDQFVLYVNMIDEKTFVQRNCRSDRTQMLYYFNPKQDDLEEKTLPFFVKDALYLLDSLCVTQN
jgi:hypothetical protein